MTMTWVNHMAILEVICVSYSMGIKNWPQPILSLVKAHLLLFLLLSLFLLESENRDWQLPPSLPQLSILALARAHPLLLLLLLLFLLMLFFLFLLLFVIFVGK